MTKFAWSDTQPRLSQWSGLAYVQLWEILIENSVHKNRPMLAHIFKMLFYFRDSLRMDFGNPRGWLRWHSCKRANHWGGDAKPGDFDLFFTNPT